MSGHPAASGGGEHPAVLRQGSVPASHPAPDGSSALREFRRRCMAAINRAPQEDVEALWRTIGRPTEWRHIRRPEHGMVMVRARAGGTGQPFNLGEMTVTHCAVALDSGEVGHGYAVGRDGRRAELVALVDAMAQDPARREALLRDLIVPLEESGARAAEERSRKAAATRVDFFSLERHRE